MPNGFTPAPNKQNLPKERYRVREIGTTIPTWEVVDSLHSNTVMCVCKQIAYAMAITVALNARDLHHRG